MPFGADVLATARPHSYGRCKDVGSSKDASPLPGASCTFKLEIEILGFKKTFEATLKDVNCTETEARYEEKFVRPGEELPTGLTLQVHLEENPPPAATAVGLSPEQTGPGGGECVARSDMLHIHLAIADGEG